jgi:sulfite exporter TauE/SafE
MGCEYHRDSPFMAMVNVTPRRPSLLGIIVGLALAVVGGYLLFRNWDRLKELLMIFAGFFLLLFGLILFTASAARRR